MSLNEKGGKIQYGRASSQLEAVLETAVDAIVIIGERGVIQTFNRAAERMFGYERAEVIGQNVSILMPSPFREHHDAYLSKYLQTGEPKIIGIGREAVGKRKDGSVFPIELSVSEVLAGGSRTFTGVVRDISERRQLENEILQVSEREQQRIGHELHDGLCQELAGIAFALQSLHRKTTAGATIQASELTKVTVQLNDAIRHGRGLSYGLYPVDPQPNGLSVALSRLALDTSDAHKIVCKFQAPQDIEVRDASAATHLYRIAQEAVREALRHGHAQQITIGLVDDGHTLTLSICDNGLSLLSKERYRSDMAVRMMHHRAKVIGANLRLECTESNRGVRVICQWARS